MTRRIYIDLGANVGDTVSQYMEKSSRSQIYAFEPNPKLAKHLKKRFKGQNVFVSAKAAWIIDGVMTLYLGHDLSSTLVKGKIQSVDYPEFNITYKRKTLVQTIDFARWLLEHVSFDDYVVIKMDIEGSEYKVLQRLVDTDAIDLVDVIYCEFHYKRFGISEIEHDRIVDVVKKRADLREWG